MTRFAASSRSAHDSHHVSTHTSPSPQKRNGRRGPSRRGGAKPAAPARPEPAGVTYEPSAFDPAPIPFDKLSLDSRLLSGIRDLGWSETRSVQSGVIPLALAGKIGRAHV